MHTYIHTCINTYIHTYIHTSETLVMVALHFSVRACRWIVDKCDDFDIKAGALGGIVVWRTGSSVYREIPVIVVKHTYPLLLSICS